MDEPNEKAIVNEYNNKRLGKEQMAKPTVFKHNRWTVEQKYKPNRVCKNEILQRRDQGSGTH